jgi:hypothetical protein
VDTSPEVAKQRPAVVRERRLEAGGGIEGLGDLEELRRVEPAATRGAPDPGLDVVRGSDPHAGAFLQQLPGLVGLVEPARDDHGVARWLQSLGEAARRVERGLLGEPGSNLRELEQRDRARVHGVRHRGRPLIEGLPAMVKRHGADAHGSAA